MTFLPVVLFAIAALALVAALYPKIKRQVVLLNPLRAQPAGDELLEVARPAPLGRPISEQLEVIRQANTKVVLFLYRAFALVTLYGVLGLVLGYAVFMGFYAINSSWAAPAIISQSNDSIIAMSAQLVASKQLLDSLMLDRNRLQESISTMRTQRDDLLALDKQLDPAIAKLQHSNVADGTDLTALIDQKRKDLTVTKAMDSELDTLNQQVDKDKAAGLMTKGEAAQQRVAITQFKNTYTDNRVGEVLLRDNLRQKTEVSTEILGLLGQRVTLEGQISQLEINMSIGGQELRTDQDQIEGINRAVATIKQSPFYVVTQAQEGVHFAFVPYENETWAQPGAPVYDCVLSIVVCKEVGTVKTVFTDEQKATHPIFKTDLRGIFVLLNLTNAAAAKSKTIFLGHKPLFL